MADKTLGKIHVVTGPGKGKTTAAFGIALRASGHGLRVCVIQFMKAGMSTGEAIAVKHIPNIEVHQYGTGEFVDPKRPSAADVDCVKSALMKSREVLESGEFDVVVLDEVNLAASYRLVDPKELLGILKSRRQGTEVILTGRGAPEELVEYADYVSYIDDKKHPLRQGAKARKGIEW